MRKNATLTNHTTVVTATGGDMEGLSQMNISAAMSASGRKHVWYECYTQGRLYNSTHPSAFEVCAGNKLQRLHTMEDTIPAGKLHFQATITIHAYRKHLVQINWN